MIRKRPYKLKLKTAQLAISAILTSALVVGGFYYFNAYSDTAKIINRRGNSILDTYIPVVKTEKKIDNSENITKYIDSLDGEYFVYFRVFDNNMMYKYHEDEIMYAASLYKVPVAVSVLKYIQDGKGKLTDKLTFTQNDYYEGTGIINSKGFGTEFTVEETLSYLLKYSDNSGQAMLLRYVPHEYVKNTLSLIQSFKDGPRLLEDNYTSAYVYSNFLNLINSGNYINKQNKELLFGLLKNTQFDDRLSPYLTKQYDFAHKIGSWANPTSWHDCGIVYEKGTYKDVAVVCVMSKNATYEEYLTVCKTIGDYLHSLL